MNWHVAKIGGSLLERTDLAGDLRAWLQQRPRDSRVLLIVGGGQMVDSLRDFQQRLAISDESAHWLAIDLLDSTSNIVGQLLPEIPAVATLGELLLSASPVVRVLPATLLRDEEPTWPGTPLGIGWQVTSDSIAARMAEILGANRLSLLKSCDWPAHIAAGDWRTAAEMGYVDGDFGRHVPKTLEIECQRLPFSTSS